MQSRSLLPAILLVGAGSLSVFISKIEELDNFIYLFILLLSEFPFSSDSWLFYSPVYRVSSRALWAIPQGFTDFLVKKLSSYSPRQGHLVVLYKSLIANISGFVRYHCLCHRHEVPSSVTMRTVTDNMQINGNTCILVILYSSVTMGWLMT